MTVKLGAEDSETPWAGVDEANGPSEAEKTAEAVQKIKDMAAHVLSDLDDQDLEDAIYNDSLVGVRMSSVQMTLKLYEILGPAHLHAEGKRPMEILIGDASALAEFIGGDAEW